MNTDKNKYIQKVINKIVLLNRKEVAASKHLHIALQKFGKTTLLLIF